jgi:hypothetical protein
MFGRTKSKSTQSASESRHRVMQGDGPRPFSYYTSRISGVPEIPRTAPARQLQTQASPEQKHSTRTWLSGWAFWVLLIVVIACAGKVLLLSNNPKIVVVGKTPVTATYMQSNDVYAAAAQKILATSVTSRSKLTIDPNGVAEALKQQFPELLDVSMSIPLVSNRPVLYLQPAAPTLVLETAKGNYALSKTGVVLSRLHSLPAGVPLVVDQSGLTPQSGRQVLPSGTVTFATTVAYQFAAKHLAVSAFALPANTSYELDARLEGQTYAIRFNLQADALTQSGAVLATLHQLGEVVPSQYLDVRVPGKVYYK